LSGSLQGRQRDPVQCGRPVPVAVIGRQARQAEGGVGDEEAMPGAAAVAQRCHVATADAPHPSLRHAVAG
jgi:hypothetical protein